MRKVLWALPLLPLLLFACPSTHREGRCYPPVQPAASISNPLPLATVGPNFTASGFYSPRDGTVAVFVNLIVEGELSVGQDATVEASDGQFAASFAGLAAGYYLLTVAVTDGEAVSFTSTVFYVED